MTSPLILKSTGEWEPAAAEFRRALALDSTYATGHQWYAEVLIITGHVRDAVVELERARDLEPLSPVINAELGYALGLAGRYQEGILAGQRAVELDSTLWTGQDPWLYAMSINAPIFDAIRDDPRFANAAKTMKLDPAAMAKPSKGT